MATWIGLVALNCLLLWGCSDGSSSRVPPPPPPHPLELKGQDCLGCHEHETWNLAAMHDHANPGYDADCIKCHGTMLDEETLDPQCAGPHTVMLPRILTNGQTQPSNEDCARCHQSTDFDQKSGADLRRHVYVSWCWACHKESGPYKPSLYRN